MSENQDTITNPDELDKPIPKNNMAPLELLPDREWIQSVISVVEFRRVIFNGSIQYVTREVDGVKENVLNDQGDPIERREYRITFLLNNYALPNGSPRRAWLQVGNSFSDRSQLPKILKKLNYSIDQNGATPTPREVIDFLTGKNVLIQIYNKDPDSTTGEIKQAVVKDAIKLAEVSSSPTPPTETPQTTAPQAVQSVEAPQAEATAPAEPFAGKNNNEQIVSVESVQPEDVAWDE